MMLAAAALGAIGLGATGGTSVDMPIVSIAASIAMQSALACAVDVTTQDELVEVGVVQFPAAVDSAKSYFLVSNNARALLASPITASDLSVTLAGDLSKFKSSGALTLDLPLAILRTASSSEVVYYSGKAGQVLTLTARAQDGTTAKEWAQGSAIESRIIERHHEIHTEALIAVETEVLANKALLDGKADAVHSHAIADVSNLQASLDAKAAERSRAHDG